MTRKQKIALKKQMTKKEYRQIMAKQRGSMAICGRNLGTRVQKPATAYSRQKAKKEVRRDRLTYEGSICQSIFNFAKNAGEAKPA